MKMKSMKQIYICTNSLNVIKSKRKHSLLLFHSQAPLRKDSNRGRKRGRSMRATGTPEMKRMQDEARLKADKALQLQRNKGRVSKKLRFELDDDSDSDMGLSDILNDESDTEGEEEDYDNDNALKLAPVENVRIGDYVLCEFATKTTKFYYVGLVNKEKDSEGDVEIDFFRCKGRPTKHPHFVKPSAEDISNIYIDSIKAILPSPTYKGTTARTKNDLVFNVNFGTIDLR